MLRCFCAPPALVVLAILVVVDMRGHACAVLVVLAVDVHAVLDVIDVMDVVDVIDVTAYVEVHDVL